MRSLVLFAVLAAAACAHRFPGSDAVPAATQYKPSAAGANALAGRLKASAKVATLFHDGALDEVARLVADEYPNGHATPGPLYFRELLWRRGIVGSYEGFVLFQNWDSALRRQRLEQHLSETLEMLKLDKRCFGISFTSNPSPSTVSMVWGRCWVDVKPFPTSFAGGETFTLEGSVRHQRAMSMYVYAPGETQPRSVNLAEDGTWPPIEINVPQTPGRYFIELTTHAETEPLLFVPITVGPAGPLEAIDVPAPTSEAGVEAAVRAIVNQHRTRAGLPALATDPKADALLRQHLVLNGPSELTEDERKALGMTRAWAWATWSKWEDAQEYALISVMRPSFSSKTNVEADLLVVAAADWGSKGWTVATEILKKK